MAVGGVHLAPARLLPADIEVLPSQFRGVGAIAAPHPGHAPRRRLATEMVAHLPRRGRQGGRRIPGAEVPRVEPHPPGGTCRKDAMTMLEFGRPYTQSSS